MHSAEASAVLLTRHRVLLAACFLFYLLLAASSAWTTAPWNDEATFANPGIDLITRGSMGMSVVEPTGLATIAGVRYEGIQRNVYAGGHLFFILSAAWDKIAGVSVISMRAMSVLAGLLLLLAWYRIMVLLSGKTGVALLAVAVIGINHIVVDAAADGRPDMLCAAFGAAAIAVYLALRQSHLTAAVTASHALLAATALVHPNALLYLVDVLIATFYLDWRRLRFKHLLCAAAVYAVMFAPSVIYFLHGGQTALVQLRLNSANRVSAAWSPLSALRNEIVRRYLEGIYLPDYATGVSRARVIILGFYLLAIGGCLATPRIRRQTGCRMLLLFTASTFLLMALLEGNKVPYYLVHIMPLYCALLALWLAEVQWPRLVAAAVLTLYAAANVGWIAYDVRRDPLHREYAAAVQAVRRRAAPQDLIIAPAQFGFAFGFFGNLTDDASLGYFTGERARWIITDQRAYEEAFKGYAKRAPYLDAYVRRLLSQEYSLVYQDRFYHVYNRQAGLPELQRK